MKKDNELEGCTFKPTTNQRETGIGTAYNNNNNNNILIVIQIKKCLNVYIMYKL